MSSSAQSPSSNGHPGANNGASMEDLLYGDPDPRRTSQLHDLLHTLWEGKWIVIGVVVLVVAAAAAYTYSIPTTYRTSSLLLVDREGQSSVLAELGQGRRSPFGQQDKTLQNELLVLRQSQTIAKRVAERLMGKEVNPAGAPLDILHGPEGGERSLGEVTRRVQAATSAQPSGDQTDGLYISASSHDSYEAGLIANLYAEEYIERTREKSRADLRASREFLEEQADTLRSEVRAAEREIESYMQENNAVSLDQRSGRIVQQVSDLDAQRAQLRIELDMKRASLDAQRQELEEIEPRLAERLSSSLEERLSRLQQEKATVESRIDQVERENPNLEPGNPLYRDLERMKDRAAMLERRTDSLANEYVRESLSAGGVAAGSNEDGQSRGIPYVVQQRRELAQKRIEINGTEARLNAVEERLQENRQALEEIPERSMQLAHLQRQRRSSEQIYNFVQEKLQEARLAERSEMGYAEVIRPAGPGQPVSPDTRRNLLLAFLLGSLLGGGLVVVRETLDTRIYQPGDLREHGHRVLGVVPSMTPLIESEFDGEEFIEVDGHSFNTLLAMIVSPMSAAAEAYRRIRTNLRFAKPDNDLQALVVTSADKGDGKTTTCANLALALASGGQRTIIIDADLRRPRMHQMFSMDREPGLSTVLYEDVSLSSFATEIEDLSLIPAGEMVPNPAELLGSERMAQLLASLRREFDYVLLDTPPALLFSDVLGLAPRCDGTILVAGAGATDGRAYDHAAELLADVDADLVGGVLNQFDATSSILESYGYNYGYSYSYRRLYEYYEEDDRSPSFSASGIKAWWNG